MEPIATDLLENDDDDDLTTITPWELALTSDLTREDDDDDELGLRALYERPEVLLGGTGGRTPSDHRRRARRRTRPSPPRPARDPIRKTID